MGQIEHLEIRALVHRHWPLLAIIGLFLLLGILYMWVMPPFEGPDEPQHLAYIEWLAEGKGFPPQGDAAWDTPIEQEAGQSPLYYMLASLPARAIDLTSPRAEFHPNPYAFTGVGQRLLGDNNNRAIHYPGEVQSITGGWLALYAARLISLSFGVLLLISTYGLARQVAPDDLNVAVAAALLVAVTPQVIFISSVVSNDIPAAALSALTLWLLARMIRLGLSGGRALGVGLAYGLAILTKSSAAALGLVTAGWWLIRSWIRYDSPLGLSTHDQTPWAISDPEALARLHMRWLDVFRSFWIALGWGTIRPNGEWVYLILLSLALLALGGLIIALASARKRLGRRPLVKPISIVILLLATVGVALSLEVWMHRVIAPYGRLMFPALAAIAVLLAIGWFALDRRLPFIVSGAVLALALLSPFLLVRPAHALPEALSPEEIAQLSSRIDVRFGDSIDDPLAILLKAEVQRPSVPAGQYLPVELCWQPVRQSEDPYTVLVHIIGPEEGLLAGRRTYPGLGHLPTTIWEPDYVVCDLVHVIIWEDLPETLVYQVEVAMLDAKTDERLPVFGADGIPLPGIFVDRAHLVSEVEPATFVEAADSGGQSIQIVDSDLNTKWSPGDIATLNLEWVTHEPLTKDYQVFVHLRDPENGAIAAQADGPPRNGWYPTSYWPVGKIISDERAFPVPADLPPGAYNLVVGLYDLESLEQIGESFDLGSIEIGS
jgi:hypothetical protein